MSRTAAAAAAAVPRLDLRHLDPPEPMRRALEAVEAIEAGERVEIITDREPLLLYRELDRRGHRYIAEHRTDGFHITLYHAQKESGARSRAAS